jgi:hypothetical protein
VTHPLSACMNSERIPSCAAILADFENQAGIPAMQE